jgi:DNA-directed RNA polymerase subunit RPC12/RpoP
MELTCSNCSETVEIDLEHLPNSKEKSVRCHECLEWIFLTKSIENSKEWKINPNWGGGSINSQPLLGDKKNKGAKTYGKFRK